MKKILSVFLLSIVALIAIGTNVQAAEGDVELYPYDQQACLESTDECTSTKLGDSHWDVSFNGYNYNIPRGGAQYVTEFSDDDSDGYIGSDEITGTVWGSVGGVYINDTASEVIINPTNANRSDLTGAWRGIWVYFDENGDIQMFEAFVTFTFDIFNDGDETTPDWRLASESEVTALTAAQTALADAQTAETAAQTAYDALVASGTATQGELDAAMATLTAAQGVATAAQTALDPIAAVTVVDALVRMKVDSTDTDGYLLEQIGFLNWNAVNGDATDDDPTDLTTYENNSALVAGDPSNIVVPAGWTVVSLGTIERSYSPGFIPFVESIPEAIAAGDSDPAEVVYDDQPGWFEGLSVLDDDAATPGVNVVVDYNATFTMPVGVDALWTNMFDDTSGLIINSEDELDYTVDIKDLEGNVLETISYAWNPTTMVYDMDAEQTVIDTSDFGAGYMAEYMATTPEGDEFSYTIDIVVGVMPPTFSGIEDRYINENTFVDLMEGITADDGYGNDITSTIEVSAPDGFNVYNPIAGEYTIELEFTHHVHIPGIAPILTADGVEYTYDTLNSDAGYNGDHLAIYDDETNMRDIVTEYAMIYIVVGDSGTIEGIYDRYNWNWITEAGTDSTTYAGAPDQWQEDLVLEDGGFLIVVGRYNAAKTALRALPLGTAVSFQESTPDFDYDIIVEDSYMLTVDDKTDPHALVVSEDYMIVAGEYVDIDEAILANVVAFDLADAPEDLAIYVSDNGGLMLDTVGTYAVEVTVEDMAGNISMVEFDVEVVAAPVILTEADVQALIDAAVADAVADALTDTEIQALIDDAVADALTEADVQALIDASQPEDTGCGSSLAIGSSLVGIFALFGGAGLFFIRRRKH